MATGNEYNVFKVMQARLEYDVKQKIEKVLLDRLTEQYNAIAKAEVKALLKKITFQKIEDFKSLTEMRDEVHCFMHWDDEPDDPVK
jgi:hypothetical protein